MKEILVTSSALILALLALRQVFRNQISRRAQYALWLLVLARLLIPVSLPAADFSLLTATEPVSQAVMRRLEYQTVYRQPLDSLPPEESSESPAPSAQPGGNGASSGEAAVSSALEESYHPLVIVERMVSAAALLTSLWYTGMVLMGLWLLMTNLRFWHNIRKARRPYAVEGCRYPVYLVESGLPSPCLFGLIHPAIYLTPASLETTERLRHVIAHESAHARHFDPLWALLRSICLVVWWFNPLVWAAAAASRADGELACDEAALASLGPAERVPYGRTLLALIPVEKGPADPLLSATTMTAGKRRLKDRITRIAENRQTRSAALMAVLALAAIACAVTFTGAKGGTAEATPLTGEELAYFNEEFFNQDGGNCIPNQFLNFLFSSPEEVDVFALFFNGTGMTDRVTAEEWQRLEGSVGQRSDQFWSCRKISAADMDAILLTYTGLTAADMDPQTLESFIYLPEYDAYYFFRPLEEEPSWTTVQFSAGEREGDTVRLYCQDFSFGGYSTRCVTLAEQPYGSWRFVSHLLSERPAIPTVYPAWEPVMTIPLTDLEPLAPTPLPVTRHSGDQTGENLLTGVYDDTYILYQSTDGHLYAAVENQIVSDETGIVTWDVGCFFTFPEGTALADVSVTSYYDLLGHDGMVFSYDGVISPNRFSTINDYYYLDDQGQPVLLARACGTASMIDLDGDGTDELCAASSGTAQVFFQRDGRIYEADITALLSETWPEADYREFDFWDASRRNLSLWASVPLDNEADVSGTAFRWVYFDGEHLLIYKDTTTYTNHVADGIDAPEAVLSAARDRVQEELNWWQTHTGSQTYVNGVWEDVGTPAQWDDWRITSLELTDQAPAYPELGVKVYSYCYEFHTATPALVTTAGGMYMDEDGWVGGMNSDNLLVFHTMTSSGPTLLESSFPTDVGRSSDSPVFAACLARVLVENGLLAPSQVRAEDLYYMFSENQSTFLNLLGTFDDGEQTAALTTLTAYAASVAGTADGGLLDYGLQNLERNSSALTEAGRGAYQRLLAAAEDQSAVSADAVLASFRSNPGPFLGLLTHETEEAQTAALQIVASRYNSGTPAQRDQISDALHSLTQTQLRSADSTAIYDRLRALLVLPGPAERTAEDEAEILQAASERLDQWRSLPGVTDLEVTALAIDQAETERAVERYMASLYANTKGWSDDYVARLTMVRAEFTAELDGAAMDADTASLNWDPGANACLLALLPDRDTGTWKVLDSLSSSASPAA